MIEWKLAPGVGLEPTTNRLTADRSTTELPRNGKEVNLYRGFEIGQAFLF